MNAIITFAQTLLTSQAATDVAEIVADQEVPTDYETEFWLLAVLAGLFTIGIYMYSNAIRSLADSGLLAKKLKNKEGQSKANLLPLIFVPGSAFELHTILRFDSADIIGMVTLNVILLGILLYMHMVFNRLLNIDKERDEVDTKPLENFTKVLTARVSMEKEHTILMDHNYDGIEELDNKLPPWWLWGFYVSIVFAVVYMFHYHVLNTGNSIEENLAIELEEAAVAREAYIMRVAMSVNETSVTLMTDADNLSKGKRIFHQHCTKCHGQFGEGLVGPNFTDDYWVYGNDIKDLFKTVKYGANLGMISWEEELNPLQMQQVCSYILSLHGTNPPGAKAPDGDFVPWPEPGEEAPEEDETEGGEDVDTETENEDIPEDNPETEPASTES